ncbi:MAG: hypothetical protein NZ455_13085 [Bacteroidia bacterium]|nr:hypothetical protein [Bacteroidia bacterium]MDW8346368.1 GldM family protein [Bacteroidia bacterium]
MEDTESALRLRSKSQRAAIDSAAAKVAADKDAKADDKDINVRKRALQYQATMSKKEAADQIFKKTEELVNYIDKVKQEAKMKCGFDPAMANKEDADPEKKYGNLKETEKVINYLKGPGDSKSGEGYKLQQKLNEYVKFLNSVKVKDIRATADKKDIELVEVPLYSLIGKKDERFDKKTGMAHPMAETPEEKLNSGRMSKSEFNSLQKSAQKDWVDWNFEGSPLATTVAELTRIANDVWQLESDFVSPLAGETTVEVKVVGFDVKVVPNAKVLVPGMKYEADIVLVPQTSANFNPTFKMGGSVLKVEKGAGKYSTIVQGNFGPNEREKKAVISGTVEYIDPKGLPTSIQFKDEYTIVKPTISVKSQSVNNLYKNCCNEVIIEVPALREFYSPIFSSTNSKLIQSPTPVGAVTIIPSGNKATVNVKSNTPAGVINIGDQEWGVISPPKPTIKWLLFGKELAPGTALDKQQLNQVELLVEADKSFAQFLPKDARYACSKVKISTKQGIGAWTDKGSSAVASTPASVSRGKVGLYSAASTLAAGSQINLEIQDLYRQGCQARENIELSLAEKTIILTTK